MLGMGLANFIAGQEWIFIIIIAVVFIFGAKPSAKPKESLRKEKLKGTKNSKTLKTKK